MLQFLVCSDVHTYTDNIRLAIRKADHIDAVLIAGDLEAEKDLVLSAVGNIPCYMVCGNNDYYLNTDYPPGAVDRYYQQYPYRERRFSGGTSDR